MNKNKVLWSIVGIYACVIFLMGTLFRISFDFGVLGDCEALESSEDFILVIIFILFCSIFHYYGFILPFCKRYYLGDEVNAMALKMYLVKLFCSVIVHCFITSSLLGFEFFLIFILMFLTPLLKKK